MYTVTGIADEVRTLRDFLADLFLDDPTGVDQRPAGVLCVDGSDRLQEVAPCGCCAVWVYDHANERTRGMVRCALAPFAECEGFRSLLPDTSTFVACERHADDCRQVLAERERDEFAELFESTGIDRWRAWPELSRELASPAHRPGREALLAAMRWWIEPPAAGPLVVR